MKIEIGEIYFYQGIGGCLFLKPIKYSGDRIHCVTFINLYDAINTPMYANLHDYAEYKEKAIVMNTWQLREGYLNSDNVILIKYKELPSERLLVYKKSNDMIIALGMSDIEKFEYSRDKKIKEILENGW